MPCPKFAFKWLWLQVQLNPALFQTLFIFFARQSAPFPLCDHQTSQLPPVLAAASESPSHVRFAHFKKQLNKVPASFKIYEIAMTAMSPVYSSCLIPVTFRQEVIIHPAFSQTSFMALLQNLCLVADVCMSAHRNSMNANASVSCCRNPAIALSGVFFAFWQD